MNERRWKVVLVDRVHQFRFPRSKKKRIRRKWAKRKKNYRQLMVPIGYFFAMGSNAVSKRHSGQQEQDPDPDWTPYFNEEDPSRPRILEFSTALWEKALIEAPDFCEKVDLFKRFTIHQAPLFSFDADVRIDRNTYEPIAPLPTRPPWLDKMERNIPKIESTFVKDVA